MPRRAPTEVIEHRISLSDYERTRLNEVITAYNRDKWLENVPGMMLGTAGVAIAGGGVVALWILYHYLDDIPSPGEMWDWGLLQGLKTLEYIGIDVPGGDYTLSKDRLNDDSLTEAEKVAFANNRVAEIEAELLELRDTIEGYTSKVPPLVQWRNDKARLLLLAEKQMLQNFLMTKSNVPGGYSPGERAVGQVTSIQARDYYNVNGYPRARNVYERELDLYLVYSSDRDDAIVLWTQGDPVPE